MKKCLSAISVSLAVALVVAGRPEGRPLQAAVGDALQGVPSTTRAHVQALASDRLEGRLAGSNGERLAGDYIVSQLQKIGAKALPGHDDDFLPFDFTAGTKDGGSKISIGAPKTSSDTDAH